MRAVIYARYSSAAQREASIDDQVRNCRKRAEAEGWALGEIYADQAVSGSRADRPAYQRMLAAASVREFDVLLLDDLSRLGRDQVESERTIRRLEFGGIRILAVCDGYDSTSKSRKVHRGVKQLFNEIYLDDLREKVHRGLTGQALQRFWAGGRPYGYRLVPVPHESRTDAYGNPERVGTRLDIDPTQAAIVREIFERFGSGEGLRSICQGLNRRGVAAPGAAWKRTRRRQDGKWLASAIFSMVRNSLYAGEIIWNRSTWCKDPDTGKRLRRDRPESAWIRHHDESLRIVPEPLWIKAQERIGRQAEVIVARLGEGRARHQAIATGRGPKYVLSGLLVCDGCGAKLVIVDRLNYGCSTHHHGGRSACANDVRLSRALLEKDLLSAIEKDLLSDEAVAEAGRRYARAMRERSRLRPVDPARVLALQAEVANLVQAIAGGLNSPALAARLAVAEGDLTRLQNQASPPKRATVTRLLPQIGQKYRTLVHRLAETLNETDPARGRAVLRELVGEVRVEVDEEQIRLISRHAGIERALARAAGAPLQISVVAGACFFAYQIEVELR